MPTFFSSRKETQSIQGVSSGVVIAGPAVLAADRSLEGSPLENEVSHACGGCDSASPCGSCGGNVAKSHPAYQALSWGVRQMRPQRDPFWAGAAVAQTVRDAAPNVRDPSWVAVESMIQRVQSVQVVATQGENARGMLLRAWRGDEDLISFLADPTTRFFSSSVVDDGLTFPMIGMMAADACCATIDAYVVTKLEPKMGLSIAPQLGLPDSEPVSGSLISAQLSVKAHFREGKEEDGTSCVCACCEFRQEVVANVLTLTCEDKRIKDPKNPTDGMEDCTWFFKHVKRNMRWTQPGPKSKPPPSRVQGGFAYAGPACPGYRKPIPTGIEPGPGQKKPLDYPADRSYNDAGNCEPEFKDQPSQFIPANCKFSWSFSVSGKVISGCPGGGGAGPVVAKFEMEGSTDSDGKVTLTPPKAAPK